MKFVFPLKTVQRVRRHEEAARKKALAEAMRQVQEIEENIARIGDELFQFSRQPMSATFSATQMEARYAYIHGLHKERHELDGALTKAKAVAEKERLKLVDAHRKTKILDNLEAKKRLEWFNEENRLEQLELNETATIRFNRRLR
jgi:flagellar export protein FliJ